MHVKKTNNINIFLYFVSTFKYLQFDFTSEYAWYGSCLFEQDSPFLFKHNS